MSQYKTYPKLDLPNVAKEVLDKWEANKVFEKSISTREGKDPFVFYEGPPSANGLPGIHHAMGRTIKDLFCRYKTVRGCFVALADLRNFLLSSCFGVIGPNRWSIGHIA